MERHPVSEYSTLNWWEGIENIAPDEYCTKREMMWRDHKEGVISFEEYKKREEELMKEVVDVLGQPQRRRPYCESDLSECEWEAKKRNPSLFMEKWETMWRVWEERETKDTRWFWRCWGGEVMLLNSLLPPVEPTSDDPHKLVNGYTSDFESRLKTMQSTLEESQAYAPAQIAQVAAVLESPHHLSRKKRHGTAQTLVRVQRTLSQGFEKLEEGIATLLKAVQNGLAPETKGYKALQENFDEFVQATSLTILDELALKAYSKGLISRNGKEEILAPGGSGLGKANKFLELIRARIKRDGKAYDTFVSILKSEPAYHHLVTLAGGT